MLQHVSLYNKINNFLKFIIMYNLHYQRGNKK